MKVNRPEPKVVPTRKGCELQPGKLYQRYTPPNVTMNIFMCARLHNLDILVDIETGRQFSLHAQDTFVEVHGEFNVTEMIE